MITDNFIKRHNGPRAEEVELMLKKIGVASLDELIDKTVPSSIRLKHALDLPKGMNEFEYMNRIRNNKAACAAHQQSYNWHEGEEHYQIINCNLDKGVCRIPVCKI